MPLTLRRNNRSKVWSRVSFALASWAIATVGQADTPPSAKAPEPNPSIGVNAHSPSDRTSKDRGSNDPISGVIESVGRALVGRRYLRDPLGEGPAGDFDRDPLYRLEAFDCTTYVETVLAIAEAGGLDSTRTPEGEARILDHLNSIRYRSAKIAFAERNRFAEIDWVPNLISRGYADDVTASIARDKLKFSHADIDVARWLRAQHVPPTIDPIVTSGARPREANVPYVPFEQIADILDTIPSSAIINIVHEGHSSKRTGVVGVITHQGFLIRRPGYTGKKAIFRHASLSGKVEERVFLAYLKSYAHSHKTFRGIQILKPRTKIEN